MKSFTILFIFLINLVLALSNFTYDNQDVLEEGFKCIIEATNLNQQQTGICQKVIECPPVLKNIRKKIFSHKVCGYVRDIQIVCCPIDDVPITPNSITPTTSTIIIEEPRPPVNYKKTEIIVKNAIIADDHNCITKKTNEKGYLKFLKHCPELGNNFNDWDTDICPAQYYDLCNDLVCCPIRNKNRLKQQCKSYDNPDYEIQAKQLLNVPCVTQFDIPSVYTPKCLSSEYPQIKLTESSSVVTICCPVEFAQRSTFNTSKTEEFNSLIVTGSSCSNALDINMKGKCQIEHQCPQNKVINNSNGCSNPRAVCCKEDSKQNIEIVDSKSACEAYSKYTYTYKFQVPEFRVHIRNNFEDDRVEAITAKPMSNSYMAALGYLTSNSTYDFRCSGSLISDLYVLTTGNCLQSYDITTGVKITVGKVRLGALSSPYLITDDDCPEDYNVRNITFHPDYTLRSYYNNIGLIKLDRQVIFNLYVHPICLPTSDITDNLIAVGYQSIGEIVPENDRLVNVKFSQLNVEECDTFFTNRRRLMENGILDEQQICARPNISMEPTCPREIGSALICSNPSYYKMSTLVGVATFGEMCGFVGHPTIYIKVSYFVPWIEGIVWEGHS